MRANRLCDAVRPPGTRSMSFLFSLVMTLSRDRAARRPARVPFRWGPSPGYPKDESNVLGNLRLRTALSAFEALVTGPLAVRFRTRVRVRRGTARCGALRPSQRREGRSLGFHSDMKYP